MFELKAALYSGSTESLIREAVSQFKGETPVISCRCGQVMKRVKRTKEYEFDVAGEKYVVKVYNVPAHECACGTITFDLMFLAKLEEVIGDEVLYRLNSRQPLPEEIDLYDLLLAE
ncbi:hypothetical protein [Kroppenstedtia guangzhouensis]|nr:hypothetical protein [Kroppenstedtia guangzhouensis]